MAFQPEVDDILTISDAVYRTAEHPAAPGMPYGQEGRQAVVYRLTAQDGDAQALKVFKPRYRSPALVSLADRIAPFARLTGLRVCRRTVLAPQRHAPLLRQHPNLTYAVLMPWVEGPTWMEVLLEKRALSPEESLALARLLAGILVGMEQTGLAHCDLSGPNVLLPALVQPVTPDQHPLVELVDVEQLYGSDLRRPELLPGGSPGYAHKTAPQGLWSSTADRFAGAVLLGEILGWCDERVREAAWGENYFDPQEMQRDSERLQILVTVLRERWRENVAGLFERAWRSEVLADCATFGEWLVTLPEEVPVVEAAAPAKETESEREGAIENTLQVLMGLARQFEEQGNLGSALQTYRQAQALAPAESGLVEELALIVQGVEERQAEAAGPEPHMLEEAEEEPAAPAPQSALQRELALIEEAEEMPISEPVQPVEEMEVELPVAKPQLAEEVTEGPGAPAPQSALAAELALVGQDVEMGAEEPSAPGPRLPTDEEPDLDRLFDEGLAAYEREEWAKAQELLTEIMRRQPGYARDGQMARGLLAEAEKQLARPRRYVPSWIWVLGGLVVLAAVGVVVAAMRTVLGTMLFGGGLQPVVEPTSTQRPTATATAAATATEAVAEAMDTPRPTDTPVAFEAWAPGFVGQIGGGTYAVAVQGQYAYIGVGPRFVILDISESAVGEGMILLPGVVMDVALAGEYAYVAAGGGGLRVVDVSDPTAPCEVNHYETPGSASGVALVGEYAYVAAGDGGLRVVNVSDPTDPREVGYYETLGWAVGVALAGNYAYVAANSGGLRVVDVSYPTGPREVGYCEMPVIASGVALAGKYAYVAADYDGLRVVDISDPAAPQEVGYCETPGRVSGVALAGEYAYVVAEDYGLRVVDVSDPTAPREMSYYETPGWAVGVALAGEYAYVASRSGGLRVMDISDPTAPREVNYYGTPGDARRVTLAGEYAYVVAIDGGLWVVDVSDPTAPLEVGYYEIPGRGFGVALAGEYAYVAAGSGGLRVVDISDPTVPREASYYETGGWALGVTLVGNYAYVAVNYGGLWIVDVSDPAAPREVGYYETPWKAQDVAVAGENAYVATYDYGLRIVDVSNSSAPREVGYYKTPGEIWVWGVAVAGEYAYVAAEDYGLRVVDISDPTAPREVGYYETPGWAVGVALAGEYAYVAGSGGVRVVDISAPTAPCEVNYYETPWNASGVALAGEYAYVAAEGGGLIIFHID